MNGAVVRAVAAAELRRRGRALVGIGLAAGLVAAVVVGTVAAARRTSTAFDRLVATTAVDDLRALTFGSGEAVAADIAALPEVEDAWIADQAVARLEGRGVVYLGVLSGPARPDDLIRPVVLDGRLADPDDPDEVVVVEDAAEGLGVGPGDALDLAFLTPEEVGQFDVGFGEPDGPRRSLRITGVVRLPGTDSAPVLATPAFAARDGAATSAGSVVALRLRRGAADVPAVRAAADHLAADAGSTEGSEEFVPVDLRDPLAGRDRVDAAAGALVGGLAVLAVAVAAAGLLAATQALARHHAGGADDQRVEAALGLTPGERVSARALAAAVTAATAAVGAVVGGLVAGSIEPLGAVAAFEPDPGYAANVGVVVLGAAVTAVAVLAVAAATAAAAGRAEAAGRSRATARPVGAMAAGPSVATGLAFRPHRAALVGTVVGVAGMAAALTFAASLDRLVGTPTRWGWDAEVAVVDANPDIVDSLLADERVGALTVLASALVDLDGEPVTAYAAEVRRPGIDLTVLDGRLPAADDEVAVGSRVGAAVGDRLTAATPDGGTAEVDVVGVIVLPPLAGSGIGDAVALTPEGLDRLGLAQPFEEALVQAAPGTDAGALVGALGERYEIEARAVPAAVDDLDQLGALPQLLGAVLAAIGAAALVHALATTVRRRGRELAALRAVGMTPGQVAWSIAVSGVATGALGLAVGVPLGWAVGRLVWWSVADAVGVATDAVAPAAALAALALAVPVVALVATARAAHRASRLSPAVLLRSE